MLSVCTAYRGGAVSKYTTMRTRRFLLPRLSSKNIPKPYKARGSQLKSVCGPSFESEGLMQERNLNNIGIPLGMKDSSFPRDPMPESHCVTSFESQDFVQRWNFDNDDSSPELGGFQRISQLQAVSSKPLVLSRWEFLKIGPVVRGFSTMPDFQYQKGVWRCVNHIHQIIKCNDVFGNPKALRERYEKGHKEPGDETSFDTDFWVCYPSPKTSSSTKRCNQTKSQFHDVICDVVKKCGLHFKCALVRPPVDGVRLHRGAHATLQFSPEGKKVSVLNVTLRCRTYNEGNKTITIKFSVHNEEYLTPDDIWKTLVS